MRISTGYRGLLKQKAKEMSDRTYKFCRKKNLTPVIKSLNLAGEKIGKHPKLQARSQQLTEWE